MKAVRERSVSGLESYSYTFKLNSIPWLKGEKSTRLFECVFSEVSREEKKCRLPSGELGAQNLGRSILNLMKRVVK